MSAGAVFFHVSGYKSGGTGGSPAVSQDMAYRSVVFEHFSRTGPEYGAEFPFDVFRVQLALYQFGDYPRPAIRFTSDMNGTLTTIRSIMYDNGEPL